MSSWRETLNEPGQVLSAERINVATTAPELKRLYVDEEMSTAEIADKLGCSQTTVLRFMDKAGIERRKYPDYYEGRLYRDEDWLREQVVEKRRSFTDIAADLDVSANTVGDWARKYNLPDEIPISCNFHLSQKSKNNYPAWTATGECEANYLHVHRLVAIAEGADPYEIFDPDSGKQVHHRNGFKCDNRPSNLDVIDASTHGRHHTPDNVKWTDDDIEYVIKAMMNLHEYTGEND